VAPLALVLGKFAAALGLVALALALTLPLPVTVSLLGPLDWGPVVGGYVATLFLAAAYVAIGLYMSARTDNPIVALILTAVVCGLFYLIGSNTLTTLFGHEIGGVLALLGTGTRFESITRGVLDLRDLYYYLSIVGVFLTLNLFGLERLRWAGNPASSRHRLWGWAAGLLAANFVAANLWLAPVGWARADITAGNIHSLSQATERQLARLSEPLQIRGYFSAKTHPLLAPWCRRSRTCWRSMPSPPAGAPRSSSSTLRATARPRRRPRRATACARCRSRRPTATRRRWSVPTSTSSWPMATSTRSSASATSSRSRRAASGISMWC
jgi:ABC-2 type transport system permease protein